MAAKKKTKKLNVRPLRDHVVIEPMQEEEKTESGLYLPETADKGRPEQGKVVAVGPGKVKDGKRVSPDVKVGDVVLFAKYGPSEIKIGGEEYLVAEEKDILAVLEK